MAIVESEQWKHDVRNTYGIFPKCLLEKATTGGPSPEACPPPRRAPPRQQARSHHPMPTQSARLLMRPHGWTVASTSAIDSSKLIR